MPGCCGCARRVRPYRLITSDELLAPQGSWPSADTQLGEGGQGAVYRAKFAGRAVAVKRIPWDAWKTLRLSSLGDHYENKELESLRRETALLATLRHPNIVQLIGASFQAPHVYMVSELVTGPNGHHDLRHCLDDPQLADLLTATVRRKMLRDVAAAGAYLHRAGVLHRDIKAANVLVDMQGWNPGVSLAELVCKLTDFGLSRKLPQRVDAAAGDADEGGDRGPFQSPLSRTVTRKFNFASWLAPEIVNGEDYGRPSDVFSLGILGCVIITGMSEDGIPRVPGQEFTLREEDGGDTFASAHMGSVDIDALRDVMRPLQLHRGSTQGAVVDLALACLVDAPNERPTMEQMERRLGEAVDEKTAASEDGP